MTGFLLGLLAGLALAAVAVGLLALARSRGVSLPGLKAGGRNYDKVMIASVARPFEPEGLDVAVRLAGKKGTLETVYVAEIPLNRPLESGAESELATGMEALEDAARIARDAGRTPLPRIERSRLGSRTIVEIQREEGFDVVVMTVTLGNRSEREGRKIAGYVGDHATCDVVVVTIPAQEG